MVLTFVVSADLNYCCQVLDNKRLNKQALEASCIIKIIDDPSKKGYQNHPTVNMWRGHVDALKLYFNYCVIEWINRGFKTTRVYYNLEVYPEFPWWWNSELLHLTHKCSLLRKNVEHYSKYFSLNNHEKEFIQLGYFWPSYWTKEDTLNKSWKNLCSVIGSGAPAQYQYTLEEIQMWLRNPTVNPKTGRTISTTAKTGKIVVLRKAAIYYKLA